MCVEFFSLLDCFSFLAYSLMDFLFPVSCSPQHSFLYSSLFLLLLFPSPSQYIFPLYSQFFLFSQTLSSVGSKMRLIQSSPAEDAPTLMNAGVSDHMTLDTELRVGPVAF